MNERLTYINTIQNIAAVNMPLSGVAEAVTRDTWLRKSDHVTLSISPSVGAFADWCINEDGTEPRHDRATWEALSSNVAWYAAYMDVVVNRKPV